LEKRGLQGESGSNGSVLWVFIRFMDGVWGRVSCVIVVLLLIWLHFGFLTIFFFSYLGIIRWFFNF